MPIAPPNSELVSEIAAAAPARSTKASSFVDKRCDIRASCGAWNAPENNRAENSHRPVRKREWAMQRFKSPEQAQGFLETFSAVSNHFRPRRHRLSAERYRQTMRKRSLQWRVIARLAKTA